MFYFEKPKIEIAEISEDNKYGRFVVEPLERGYGITLGNSLYTALLIYCRINTTYNQSTARIP